MPANLTPQYLAAEERYKQARDDREKLKALKEMLANIPKHKGTEKLQADIKRKIARLKDDIDTQKSRGGHRFSYGVEREGAGQVVVVGPPNVGKSLLVSRLTGTALEVADYPFTTRSCQPAMMNYEDIQIQLVDLPPLAETFVENWMSSIIRVADMMLLVADISRDDLLEQMDSTLAILDGFKIKPRGLVPEDALDPIHWSQIRTLLVANKIDCPGAMANAQILQEFYGNKLDVMAVSAANQSNLAELKQKIVQALQIIRVYSKRPGHPPDTQRPFTFSRGSSLMDFARAVHKDFAENLKFARVWGEKVFDGQRINRDYLLQDKDIIELHI